MAGKKKEFIKKNFSLIFSVFLIPLWIYVFVKSGISDITILLLIAVILYYILTFYKIFKECTKN